MIAGKLIGRSEIAGYVIDTRYIDYVEEPYYETAIWKQGSNIASLAIVEQYDTIEEAEEGHAEWTRHCRDFKPRIIYDITQKHNIEL